MRSRTIGVRVLFVAAVSVPAALLGGAPAGAAGAWQVVSSPDGAGSDLVSVSLASASDGWAAGWTGVSLTQSGVDPLIARWDGHGWTQVGGLAIGQSDELLHGVSGNGSDAWAVGTQDPYGTTRIHALMLHWNGAAWTQATPPSGGGILNAVSESSPSDVWGVGNGLFEHFNGNAWSVSPPPAVLGATVAVTSVSRSDVWAVGSTPLPGPGYPGVASPYAAHWDGASWSAVPVPHPAATTRLTAVDAAGPDDVWAVGSTGSFPTKPFAVHYDGRQWSQVSISGPAGGSALSGIAVRSPTDVWAVGSRTGQLSNGFAVLRTFVKHWNGTTWTTVASPNDSDSDNSFAAIGVDPSAGPLWAVGADGSALIAKHG